MNCIEFLPFGSYLRPIQKMAKGGKTPSRGDGPATKDGTLRGLEQFLQNTIRDIDEQKDRLTARQNILPNYPEIEEEMRQALQKLSKARYIALYELGPDFFRYKRAVADFEGQGMSTREAKREAKKITGYKMEKGGTTASKPTE